MRTIQGSRFIPGLSLFCLLFPVLGRAQETGTVPLDLVVYPEVIVHNAKIVTMSDYEINTNIGATVEAMAVRDGRIWKLGKNDEVLKYAGPKTMRVDAKGRTVIPGIVNAHTHIHDHALNVWINENPNSLAVRVFRVQGDSIPELRKNLEVLLRERMKDVPENQWTFFNLPTGEHGTGLGVQFNQKAVMSAQDMDKMGITSPVLLAAQPAYVLNTPAMKLLQAMYKGEPADYPEESWDEKGYAPMGLEYRREVVVDSYFYDKTELLKEILYRGMAENAAAGITTFSTHIVGIQNLDAYMRLFRENRMPIRFGFTHYTGFVVTKDSQGFYLRLGDLFKLGNEHMWFSAIGLGQIDHGPPNFCSTIVPEADVPMHRSCRHAPDSPGYQTIVTALAHGRRVVAGHNIGDLSADYFMDAIEEAMKQNPEVTLDYIRSLRLSMDHGALYPRPDQLPRIKKLGMMISMAARKMDQSLPWIQKFGFEKYQGWVVPVKGALDAGVKVAWEAEGSIYDGVFSNMTPLITRRTSQGVIIAPDQAIDRITALKMATNWSSEFLLKENDVGSLEPGKLADFLVLSQDYFTVPLEQLNRIIPLMTVVGGKVVFLRDEFAKELGTAPVGAQIKYDWEKGGTSRSGE